MKNKLLFVMGLCYALLSGFLTPVTGQSGSHILSELHDMLDPLDMTEVTSQVLYDRGFDMYHWQYYDGSVPSDSAAFSAGSWSWIYTQASTSFLSGYSTLPSSSGYMDHMLNPSGNNTITMASMWLECWELRCMRRRSWEGRRPSMVFLLHSVLGSLAHGTRLPISSLSDGGATLEFKFFS